MFSNTIRFASKTIFRAVLLAGIFVHAAPVCAQTLYISDRLVIALRESPNMESNIIGYLESSDPVQLLEEDDDLARVRTKEGIEGWVKKKFLDAELPKTLVIKNLIKENNDLKEKLDTMVKAAGGNPTAVKPDPRQLQHISELKENAQRSKALMDQTEKELTGLLQEIASLRLKNQAVADQLQSVASVTPESSGAETAPGSLDSKLKKFGISWPQKNDLKWFMAGGGIMLFGFIVGFLSRRKKSYFY